MRNESTMVNKKVNIVLLFYIAMHDPTIYLSILFDSHMMCLTFINISMDIVCL